jgi:anti-sigma factor RsiW
MTRLFNPCRKHREELCALMSGDAPAKDRAGLEDHLDTCADCRKYRAEVGSMTALLSTGGELFRDIEPSEATQRRWAKDFEAAGEPRHSIATRVFRRFLDWTWDMVWPCRRLWAGLAAIWLLIFGLNLSQRSKEQTQAARGPSPEMLRAFLAIEGFLPGSSPATDARQAIPPRSASPQPRSEQHRASNSA